MDADLSSPAETAAVLADQFSHGAATAAAHAMAFNTAFWRSIGFSVLALVPAFLLPSAAAKKTAAQPPPATPAPALLAPGTPAASRH